MFQGPGDASRLDARFVTNLGSCLYEESWNYLQHAAVGVVVSAGPFMHNNESTKIYHYLRVGLPVVSEEGFPNDYVVRESGLGSVVPSDDMDRQGAKSGRSSEPDLGSSCGDSVRPGESHLGSPRACV